MVIITDTEIKERLTKWVHENYSPKKCGLNCLDSMGNYGDVFYDGIECGNAWAAYEVGQIIGLELEEPAEQTYL